MKEATPHRNLRQSLIGTWRLIDYAERQADGGPSERPFGKNPSGLLMYGEDDHMSVQIMKVDRPTFASGYRLDGTPEEFFEQCAGYLAYAGTFEIDEARRTVVHLPTVALFPNWIGERREGHVTLEGDELTLETTESVVPGGERLIAYLRWWRYETKGQR